MMMMMAYESVNPIIAIESLCSYQYRFIELFTRYSNIVLKPAGGFVGDCHLDAGAEKRI